MSSNRVIVRVKPANRRTRLLAVLITAAVLLAACGSGSEAGTGEATEDGSQVATLETTPSDEQAAGSDVTAAVGADDSASSAPELTFEDAQLDFSQCMRDNGYPEWPDPNSDLTAGGRGGFGGGVDLEALGIDRGDPSFRDTQQDCREVFEGVAGIGGELDPEQQAELEDSIIALFACLRENPEFEDLPDPDFTNGGGLRESLGAIFESGDFDRRELFGAMSECRDSLGLDGFGGPGGGARPAPRPDEA